MSKHEQPKIAPGNPMGAFSTVAGQKAEPMTEKQAALLRHLCEKYDEPFDASLTRRQAQRRIDALRT